MDSILDIIKFALAGLVLVYAALKFGLAMILTQRSRKEVTVSIVVAGVFIALLLIIPVLAKDVTLVGLLTEKPRPELIITAVLLLLFAISIYKNYRLRFKGQEATLLERNVKYMNLMFNPGGRYARGKDTKVYVMTYQYVVSGITYHSKKYVLGEKLSYLTRVLYDPTNPKRNIPVPGLSVDGVKY